MSKKDNGITSLTDLNVNDIDFREKLKAVIGNRLKNADHQQIVAFAIRISVRVAWILCDFKVRDESKLDRFYYYFIRAIVASFTVYFCFSDKKILKAIDSASSSATAASLTAAASSASAAYSAYAAAYTVDTAVSAATAAASYAFYSAAEDAAIIKTITYTSDAASTAVYAASAASVVSFNNMLYCLDKDLENLNGKADLLNSPLWYGAMSKFSLKLLNLDGFWNNYLFKPTYYGTFDKQKAQGFIDAFLSLDDEVFNLESANAMVQAMRAHIKGETLKFNQARLILLGNGGAGKTSLVRLLHKDPLDVSEKPTPRVSVRPLEIDKDEHSDEKITLNIWDFGGQVIMHSTHSFFISQESSYLVMCNQRANEQPDKWLDMIVARRISVGEANRKPQKVMVVYSHCDDKSEKNIHPWRRDKALIRKYTYDLDLLFFNVDMNPSLGKNTQSCCEINRKDKHFKKLKSQIYHRARKEADKEVFLVNDIKNYVDARENKGQPYITYKELKSFIKENQDDNTSHDQLTIANLLKIANNYGYIFPERPIIDKDKELRDDFVFVNQSHWLTYGVYQLVNSADALQNSGILSNEAFKSTLSTVYVNKNGEIEEEPNNDDYETLKYDDAGIAVLKRILSNYRWGFIYHQRHGDMLLPLATSLDEPDDLSLLIKQFSEKDHHVQLVLDNKPKDFFFRLATYMEPHLSTEKHLWRTGVILHFYNQDDTLAILQMPNSTLEIRIMGADQDNFLQLLLINISETLKHYKNIKAQIYERIDISKAGQKPEYEMVSSSMIEGLLSNCHLVETIKDKLLSRSTQPMTKITNLNIHNNASGNTTSIGDHNTFTQHVTINESAQELLNALIQAQQSANKEEKLELQSISQELLNGINEANVDIKKSLFEKVVQRIGQFNTLKKGADTMGEYMPTIFTASAALSKALSMV